MTTTDPTQTNGAAPAPAPVNETGMVPVDPSDGAISAFASARNFEAAQRMAKALASSSLMPQAYQGNIPNVLIALEMASRIGASVFMVAQSLDIIHGRPSWSSKFLIATVNASGRFTPLRFRWQGEEGKDTWGCRAFAKDKSDNEPCLGPLVTIAMAKAEGWYAKNGSKWKTLPELMLMYRSAGFWTRVYAPELSFGMHTSEEVIDTVGYSAPMVSPTAVPAGVSPGSTSELQAQLLGEVPHDPETGEVVDEDAAQAAAIDRGEA